jgi:hypothetical protein
VQRIFLNYIIRIKERNREMERHNKIEEMSEEERKAFDKYVKDIEKRLLELNSKEFTDLKMRVYKNILVDYWKEEWEVNVVAVGMETNLL